MGHSMDIKYQISKYTVNQGCMSGCHLGQLRRRRRHQGDLAMTTGVS